MVEGWNDLHEMVTAACYSPDGQVAMVGSHKGSCHLFGTAGSSLEVLITCADSPICDIIWRRACSRIQRFPSYQEAKSQLLLQQPQRGKCVVCGSEESDVYVCRGSGDMATSSFPFKQKQECS